MKIDALALLNDWIDMTMAFGFTADDLESALELKLMAMREERELAEDERSEDED